MLLLLIQRFTIAVVACSCGWFCSLAITNNQQRKKHHPKVLERFYVNAKDRKYLFWKRNPLRIDLWTKEVFIQKMDYVHNNPLTAGLCLQPEDYKYSSAKFYESRIDEFGILKHWMS